MLKSEINGKSFALHSTTGEAEDLFGPVSPGDAKPPRIKISIDKQNLVTFKVSGASPKPDRDFAMEANGSTRYLDFKQRDWPDEMLPMIVGHINWGKPDMQQLFLMWLRPKNAKTEKKYKQKYMLNFFFFATATRFSTMAESIGIGLQAGVGQNNGGGSGSGPTGKG